MTSERRQSSYLPQPSLLANEVATTLSSSIEYE